MSATEPSELSHACRLALTLEPGRLSGLISTPTGKLRMVRGTDFDLPEDLIGVSAHPSWEGVVVAARGRARSLDDADRSGPVELAFAVDRDNRCAAITRSDRWAFDLDEPQAVPEGLVVDVCRRVLGLATPAEPIMPIRIEHQEWLLFLLEAVTAATMTGWAEDWDLVALSHPMALESPSSSPAALGDRLAAVYHDACWDQLHTTVVRGRHPWDELDPDQVAWLDVGSFARYALGSRPSLGALLDSLEPLVPDHVHASIVATIEAAGDSVERAEAQPRPPAPAG